MWGAKTKGRDCSRRGAKLKDDLSAKRSHGHPKHTNLLTRKKKKIYSDHEYRWIVINYEKIVKEYD